MKSFASRIFSPTFLLQVRNRICNQINEKQKEKEISGVDHFKQGRLVWGREPRNVKYSREKDKEKKKREDTDCIFKM